MDRGLVALVVAFFALAPCRADGQVNLGVVGGFNGAGLGGDTPEGSKFSSSSGLAAGLQGEFLLTDDIWLSVQPMVAEKSSDLLVGFTLLGEPDTLGLEFDYVSLPVLLKFVSGNRKTYATGGLDFGLLRGATLTGDGSVDVKDSFKQVDLSANFGFGVMLPIGRPAITLEARYAQSILNASNQEIEPTASRLPNRVRFSGFQLYGGVIVPLGRKSILESSAPNARVSTGGGRNDSFRRPMLADHTFIPTTLVPDPFIKTFVRNSIGIGKARDVEIPGPLIDGDTIVGFDGDITFAFLDFEYQHAVRDWLAARGGFQVQGRLGTNVGTLLASGITAATGLEFGWLIRLLQSERTLLSADLKLTSHGFTFISVREFVEDIMAERSAELVRNTPSIRGGGGLRFAWGVSPLLGVTATAGTGYGESVARDSNDQGYFEFATTVDFDLQAVNWVPLGIALGYRHDVFPERGDDLSDNIDQGRARVVYNGESDFIVGLGFGIERFNLKRLNQAVNVVYIGVDLRYYF